MRTTEAQDAQESAVPCASVRARQNGARWGLHLGFAPAQRNRRASSWVGESLSAPP